jgi:hypothetical protein
MSRNFFTPPQASPYEGEGVRNTQMIEDCYTLITKYKNDYIIPLKRNPKKLFKAAVKISESQLSLSESQTVDISHGSQIVRKVSVFDIEPLKSADFDGLHWVKLGAQLK